MPIGICVGAKTGICQTCEAVQEGERASSLLPHEDNPADKGKGLRTQKKGKAGAGRGQGKAKKLSLLGPTALARGKPLLRKPLLLNKGP